MQKPHMITYINPAAEQCITLHRGRAVLLYAHSQHCCCNHHEPDCNAIKTRATVAVVDLLFHIRHALFITEILLWAFWHQREAQNIISYLHKSPCVRQCDYLWVSSSLVEKVSHKWYVFLLLPEHQVLL